jgi:hypothetical protein
MSQHTSRALTINEVITGDNQTVTVAETVHNVKHVTLTATITGNNDSVTIAVVDYLHSTRGVVDQEGATITGNNDSVTETIVNVVGTHGGHHYY